MWPPLLVRLCHIVKKPKMLGKIDVMIMYRRAWLCKRGRLSVKPRQPALELGVKGSAYATDERKDAREQLAASCVPPTTAVGCAIFL